MSSQQAESSLKRLFIETKEVGDQNQDDSLLEPSSPQSPASPLRPISNLPSCTERTPSAPKKKRRMISRRLDGQQAESSGNQMTSDENGSPARRALSREQIEQLQMAPKRLFKAVQQERRVRRVRLFNCNDQGYISEEEEETASDNDQENNYSISPSKFVHSRRQQ